MVRISNDSNNKSNEVKLSAKDVLLRHRVSLFAWRTEVVPDFFLFDFGFFLIFLIYILHIYTSNTFNFLNNEWNCASTKLLQVYMALSKY